MGTKDFGTVLGASLVAAVLVTLLGLTGLYKYIVKKFIPSIVSGTIIMIVGLTLLPSAFTGNIFISTDKLSINQNILLAMITAAILILFSMLGTYFPKLGKIFRISSVIIALTLGSIIASTMGGMSLDSVAKAPILSLPKFAFTGYHLDFNIAAIITMIIIYVVLLAETTGTWYAISALVAILMNKLIPETKKET